jgi:uncharacterized protein YsxB (DUF464 family)
LEMPTACNSGSVGSEVVCGEVSSIAIVAVMRRCKVYSIDPSQPDSAVE